MQTAPSLSPCTFLLCLELVSSCSIIGLKFWKYPPFKLCANPSRTAAIPEVQFREESRSVSEVGMEQAHVVGMQPCGRYGMYAIKTECSGNCAASL